MRASARAHENFGLRTKDKKGKQKRVKKGEWGREKKGVKSKTKKRDDENLLCVQAGGVNVKPWVNGAINQKDNFQGFVFTANLR